MNALASSPKAAAVPIRRPVTASAAAAAPGRRRSSTSFPIDQEQPAFPLHLPAGGVWLDRSALSQDIVYGQNFVLSRPRRGGPGLIISPRHPPLTRIAGPSSLAVHSPAPAGPPTTTSRLARHPPPLLPGGPSAIEITDYRVVGGEGEEWEAEEVVVWALPPGSATTTPAPPATLGPPQPSAPAPSATPSTADGPIRIDIHAAAAAATPHPRRTARLAFTCKLCGARTQIAFNPAASVLARCGGPAGAAAAEAALGGTPTPEGGPCGVIHVLADKLKLFHELEGPVFPPF